MRSVEFAFVASVAEGCGAVECFWRESGRSFTGFVAEVWFESGQAAGEFARGWAAVVGYSVLVRRVSVCAAPGGWVCSVPCLVGSGAVQLVGGQRGGQVRVRLS
ncbi:MAG: hypothetical protein RLZZ435_499 [Cyanobacteriota bacterium]|jgi:hypothetical protein